MVVFSYFVSCLLAGIFLLPKSDEREDFHFFETYNNLSRIYAWMDSLPKDYPSVVRVMKFGESYEKRPLRYLRISNNSTRINRPVIWIDGGIHGREWISVATAVFIADQLITSRDGIEKTLMDTFVFIIVPIANPDSYVYSWTKDRLWQKTRSKSKVNGTCRGADPYKNFNYEWGDKHSSTNPCDEYYRGDFVNSESEVKAIQDLIMRYAGRMKLFWTMQAYGQTLNLPSFVDLVQGSPYPPLGIAKGALRAIYETFKVTYGIGYGRHLETGTSLGWARRVAKVPFCYQWLLRDPGEYGYLLPEYHVLFVGIEIFKALKSMAVDITTFYNISHTQNA